MSVMVSPPSLRMLSTMALGPDDADVLSGENWKMRQLLQRDERSSLIAGEPSVLVSLIGILCKKQKLVTYNICVLG